MTAEQFKERFIHLYPKLFAVAMASKDDLDQLHKMTLTMIPDASAGKQQLDRANLCSYIPYLDENDTELLATSARSCQKR